MNKENSPTPEQITEFNHHIKEAISQWSDICLTMDIQKLTPYFDYDKQDLSNAQLIFQHVFQNIAIKKGLIASEKESFLTGCTMCDFIQKFTGIDMRKLYDEPCTD